MKKYLPILVAAAASLGANAATLTPDQALARLGNDGPVRVASAGSLSLALTETFAGTTTPAVYVFNSENGGYVVVSADDRAVPMLGYSDEGAIDPQNMAPALKYWLGEYARQIANASPVAEGEEYAPSKANRAPIAPMTKTKWDQDKPYNNECPKMTRFSTVRCYTGCVATAMAQVMKYHNYPDQGQGSHEYHWEKGNQDLSIDFSAITFDWNNMRDTYSGSTTEAQKTAVAVLMKACGYAVDMNYGTDASGAFSNDVPFALYDYFNYSKGLSYCNRNYYTIAEWDELLYSNLGYGPVYYSGQSNDGGHAFVCDGYKNGLYHFNWGWSGMSDGYYRLLALDPEEQGIGGSTSGFNFSQAITAGFRPPVENDLPVFNFVCDGMNTDVKKSANLGTPLKVKVNLTNVCVAPVAIQPGVKIVAEDGSVTYLESNASLYGDVEPMGTTALVSVTFPETMAVGVYKISPAVLDEEGNWHDVHMNMGGVRYLIGTVANGKISLAKSNETVISSTGFEVTSPVYTTDPFEVKATLVNNSDGDYVGILAPALIKNGSIIGFGDYTGVEVPAESTQEFYFFGNFSRGTAPAVGSYQIALYDITNNQLISDPVTVSIKKSVSPNITASGFTFVGDANAADASNLNFSLSLRCTLGYYAGRIIVAIFNSNGTSNLGQINSNPVFLEKGNSANVAISGALENLTVGSTYMAAAFRGTRQITDGITFKVTEMSGIEEIENDTLLLYPNPTSGLVYLSETTDAEVYNLAGSLVESVRNADTLDLTDLPAGVYLVKTGAKVHRVIKK